MLKKLFTALATVLAFAAHAQPQSAQPDNTQALTLTFNAGLTPYNINPPNVSGVINDPTDIARSSGIVVDVKENNVDIPAADYTLTASSNKTSVVPNANIGITKALGKATITINPVGVGYATITLTLTKGSSSKTLTIKYAASAASSTPANTYWHTGISDASAAIALNNDYMVMADDEQNNFYVFTRQQSGLPVKTYYYGDQLGLTDGSSGNYKEVDIEACVKSTVTPNRYYWIGSMSNAGSNNTYKPNSNRLFAATISGTASATSFAINGYYSTLREKLISWGDTHSYNFTAATANGKDAKTIDGFNIEGMTIGPDNTTLYIGFRAPLVPTGNRTKAVIAPIQNFETWFNNGSPTGNPVIGNPIELNLGGRGIRDMVKLSNGVYIIVAGNYDNTPVNGALYKWTGLATDNPVAITDMNITNLNAEACLEIWENNTLALNKLQIISDNGSYDFYNDNTEAKDLSETNYKKYRSDIITASTAVLPLPVVSFTAIAGKQQVQLQWQLNNLQELTSIQIQRSFDGSNFIPLTTLPANTTSFIDPVELSRNLYYRLQLQFKDNRYMYSGIRNVQLRNHNSIYVSTNRQLMINTAATGATVQISNTGGSLLQRYTWQQSQGSINMSGYPAGLYVVTIIGGGQTFSQAVSLP